jgi:hypothetical protein
MLYVHMVRVPRGTLILLGQLLHVPDPPRDDVLPPPTRPASYAAVTNTPPVHLAKADHVYVRVGGQQKPLVAPCDGPYPCGLQGGQDFHYPSGPKAGDRLRGQSEGPHQPWPGISCKGCPSWLTSQEAGRFLNSAWASLKAQSGGGGAHVERIVYSI